MHTYICIYIHINKHDTHTKQQCLEVTSKEKLKPMVIVITKTEIQLCLNIRLLVRYSEIT